ncbi:ubiquitin carboxyl-terminal hydrolase 34 isoform X2 [Hydra vulgaris]|uniref:Ubiquitin carboxyl-terminal hydrolase 34 isoform X2 n=1 Tax=Hydra vulgaris TaxID=6087 RepID=A0ABM4CHV4_HYDVU
MSSECCKELKIFLDNVENEPEAQKKNIYELAKAVNSTSRQCTCLIHNPALILPLECILKDFYQLFVTFINNYGQNCGVENQSSVEQIIQAISKSFQINFPLYPAYESVKNNFEVKVEEKEAIQIYCDSEENSNISELLYQNVAYFCHLGGVEAVTQLFASEKSLPLCLASSLICIIAQLRGYLHEEATSKLIKPLSMLVTKYLQKMCEDDLRLPSARSMAEMMINSVKVQDSNHPTNDIDLLNMSFKYFMSSTLAVRMAGLNLMTNQIHNLIDLSQNQVSPDSIDSLCTEMAEWLNQNEMVEHLFGPNYHVELIKQSQFLLSFLAQERQLHSKHIDCLWAAAQVKHISRYVLELLIMLAKVMDVISVQYLLHQIAQLSVNSHTKQTLLLSSLLIRSIWTAGLTGANLIINSPIKITNKNSFASPPLFKELQVSPIQSPSLSSSVSTDEEISDIHGGRFMESQLRNLEIRVLDQNLRSQVITPLLELSPSASEGIDNQLLSRQVSNDLEKCDDTVSSTQTNGSLTDQNQDILDDLDDDVSMCSVSNNPVKLDNQLNINFKVESLCEPGNTLLWDLIQEPNCNNMSDGLLEEAQKLLWQLICYSGNKKVRMVFIEGCLENIKKNQSVMVSFKILPKVLSVYPHKTSESSSLLSWAIKDLQLMNAFFNNLLVFVQTLKEVENSATDQQDSIEESIQARLEFLAAIYSNDITPDHFRLSISQVDCLWNCLVTQLPHNYHFLTLSWLLKQTDNEDLHALGLDAFKHIFVNKLSELNAEKMTLIGLSLFQKLFGLTRLSNATPFVNKESDTEEYVLGTQQLWNIALKADCLKVSNEAMNVLNHLYLTVGENSVQKEEEFIQNCMTVLREGVNTIEKNYLQSLKSIQQVLKILKNHLQAYIKRLAFHLELWNLTGRNVASHQNVKKVSSKDVTLRIVCQPTGVIDKITFKMMSCDLLATLRARITHWCIGVQERKKPNDNSTELKPPFRLISHGHELTHDLDMKTLSEIGIRDQQLVYISIMNMQKEGMLNSVQLPYSLQNPPNFESVPMIQLLREVNFFELFNLLDVLYKVSNSESYQKIYCEINNLPNSSVNDTLEQSFEDSRELVKPLSARSLLNNTWELILMLPTNENLKEKYLKLSFKEDVDWDNVLCFEQKFMLLYILQILDSISLPFVQISNKENTNGDSSGDSDSSVVDKGSSVSNLDYAWVHKVFQTGLVKHLLRFILKEEINQDEWSTSCFAYIIKLITRIGLVSDVDLGTKKTLRKTHIFRARYRSTETDNIVIIHQFSQELLDLLDENLFQRVINFLYQIFESSNDLFTLSNQDVRASVVYHCLSFLVCSVSCNEELRKKLLHHDKFSSLLLRLVFYAPQRSVRTEGAHGIYKLCLCGSQVGLNKVLNIMLNKLSDLVHLKNMSAEQLANLSSHKITNLNYKDYFWLLCRLINKYNKVDGEDEICIRTAITEVSMYIKESKSCIDNGDYCLVGLLQVCTALLQHDTDFKLLPEGFCLMQNVFSKILFNLPSSISEIQEPHHEAKGSRLAAYELLLQLVSGCKEMYLELLTFFIKHHRPNEKNKNHCSYGWNYWPYEQERSSVGYVGLINLGATCYMASCVQQLFMIPKARSVILNEEITPQTKHSAILKEVQKMFAYLHSSIRKAYNPKLFCRTYTMDKQPLNTCEQKDMTEFFTDFVSKLEEMGPDLKELMRELFCGVITNNVISLDCLHVSKTEEEFYSVRCTVADMKNLYESLDEVTVKDVLEGDNKYTCSQCNDKVRAEKRACFKTLPKVLCFNTMRYTFNMVTMMKEKVNTHFSFPMKLNMAAYTEDYLLIKNCDGDPDDNPNHWYNLAGVVVHTGTADGGHYYSFIRDRCSKENNWYLFNDAEVKTFDPMQIAAECFGGEMTTKTFDAMTEKYMDFSFEKTHSAYMLFYEHSEMDKEIQTSHINLPKDLQEMISEDNHQFLQDKLVFEPNYFSFLWQFCNNIPKTLSVSVTFHVTKLAISFLLETLVHSREKPHIKNWVELIVNGFDNSQSACEWFLDSMTQDDWWLQQMFVKCPAQHLRQMFGHLCLIPIKNLRSSQVYFYTMSTEEGISDEDDIGSCSPITRFIKAILILLEDIPRGYCKNLAELFHFMYQFLSFGHEECSFLLQIDAITMLVQFYSCLKANEPSESIAEEEEELDLEDEDILSMFPEDKFYPNALEKMIGSIALLVEAARDGPELHLSDSDLQCFTSTKEVPFLCQIIMDGINLRQTANIIFHLSCYNQQMAEMIVHLILSTIQKLSIDQSQNFFKVLSLLIEVGENGLPGLPSYTAIVLSKIWQTAEYSPALTLDWISNHVSRNKEIHKFVIENMEKWVEKYLIIDPNPRIRGGAAYLLVSLVPNIHFPQSFRGRLFSTPQKQIKMSEEAKSILKKVYEFLLKMLPSLGKYCDKSHLGTTRLVNYFTLLNYCCISNDEKAMFTPFSIDLWRLYHPLMSEPDVSIHFNKQALLTFWYHACENFEDNMKFITETRDVAFNIAYNYILSNDDQEVISYNNSTLPMYYGLLRLACNYSKQFCKTLSVHPNMTWAFEHLLPRANHYPQVIEELLNLIKLFCGSKYTSNEDLVLASTFKTKTIELVCSSIEGHNAWMTLVNVLRVLITSKEDCLHVVYSNGLNPLGEAFCTLHLMYYEATACNITNDILEVTNLLQTVLGYCQSHISDIDPLYKVLHSWEDRADVMIKALSMLNSFVAKEIQKSCLDLLHELLQTYPEEFIETVAPIIHQSHLAIRMTPQENFHFGPHFPKPGTQTKVNRKLSSLRPKEPELNMTLHPHVIESFSGDADGTYKIQLCDYFHGYHFFVDKMCRYGLNAEPISTIIIEISCLLAVEMLPLKFQFFPKLWQEVWSKSSENTKFRSCIHTLFTCDSFLEFMDALFTEERILFDDSVYYTFACIFFPKVYNKVLPDHQRQNLLNSIALSMIAEATNIKQMGNVEFERVFPKLHGDLRALSLLMSVTETNELTSTTSLEEYVNGLLERHNQLFSTMHIRSVSDEKDSYKDEKGASDTPNLKQQLIDESNKPSDEEPPNKRIRGSEPLPGPSSTSHTNISNSGSSCSSPDYSDDCDSSSDEKKCFSDKTKNKKESDCGDEKPCISTSFLNKKVVKSAQLKKACLTLLGLLSRGQKKEKTLPAEIT